MLLHITFARATRYRLVTRWLAFVLLGFAWLLAAGTSISHAVAPRAFALPDVFQDEQLMWALELGNHQYTVPRVDRGRVFLGINDMNLEHPAVESTGGGILLCLEQATGATIWQQPIPRNMEGTKAPFHFNHWKCGVCSRPAIDGNRLFIVGPRGDVLCLDRDGQANGNDGPFLEEARYMGVPETADYKLAQTDGDIVWQFDMIRQLQVVPHDVCGSSPVVYGDCLYVCTSNGVDDTHRKVANPSAPSLIALDKRTGQLRGTDGGLVGDRNLHGQWSSPVAVEIKGKAMILFGGGDGVLYAFEPLASAGGGGEVRTLKTIWKHDCCPSDYRQRDGQAIPYARWNKNSPDGPSEIIATPVVYGDRVYVAIGQSPLHGAGRGMLSCIDAQTGETIWENRQVDRTLSDAAIHDGLLYISDFSGRLNCLDADTGQSIWRHDLEAGVWCASPVIADGKVYISTEKMLLWVFKAGREKQVISHARVQSMAITPVVADDLLFLPTQRRIFAVKMD